MIIQKFLKAQKQINDYLQLSKSKISLTMNMWTSINALGILAITIHFVNNDWKFEHFVLDVFYLLSLHDALTIKNTVVEVMNNLNIGNCLIGIISDNEVKMISATKRIGLKLNLQEF